MIPKNGWKDMDCAPKDGSVIMVRSREWNNPNAKYQVQPAQWLCEMDGKNWRWRLPHRQGTTVWADDWMTFEEFQDAQAIEEQPSLALGAGDTPEFDL